MNRNTIWQYVGTITVARIGSGFMFLINTWLAMSANGHGVAAVAALAVATLPSLLFAPFIGAWIDRSLPGYIAFFADLARTVLLLGYSLLYMAGWVSLELALAVSFAVALGAEVQVLAWRTAIVRSAGPAQLLDVNAVTAIATQVGLLAGVTLAGFTIAWFGGAGTIAIGGSAFLVSAVLGWNVARRLEQDVDGGVNAYQPDAALGKRESFSTAIGLAWRHLLSLPDVLGFYAIIAVSMFVLAGLNGTLAQFSKEELGLGPAEFGIVDGFFAAGLILGGVLLKARVKSSATVRVEATAICALGLAIMAASLLFLSYATGFLHAAIGYAGVGISFFAYVAALTQAQRQLAMEFQGRVNALFNFCNALVSLAAYGICIYVSFSSTYSAFLIWMGLIAAAACVLTLFAGKDALSF